MFSAADTSCKASTCQNNNRIGGGGDTPKDSEEEVETRFLHILNRVFSYSGIAIAKRPFLFAGISLFLTVLTSVKIPFTPMTNDVADFTPYGARARRELEAYEDFFSNKGDPIVMFVLITAKSPMKNMLGLRELNETIRLLNIVSENFTVYNSARNRQESFTEFCNNFCTINEPIRHFYNGLLIEKSFGNSSTDHIDLGYPVTTVLGRQLHMDPNLFGVKVAISPSEKAIAASTSLLNGSLVASVNELRTAKGNSIFDSASTIQLPNNVREIRLIVLQFRAERPQEISKDEVKKWEMQIVNYVQNDFNVNNEYISALVLAESYLTSEVVRAGLTLLPFLVIGFCIMVVFSSCTMGLSAIYAGQMNIYKIFLAVTACSCPFMACGTALGAMFWAGFRFGSLLCVTPFLTLALGVDDAYILMSAWQRVRQKSKTGERYLGTPSMKIQPMMAEVMIDSGASITITTLTNVLAFMIGAMTPTPEIRLFSIGNALAITITYIYQWTVFGALMAVFGKWEMITEERNNQCSVKDLSSNTSSEKCPMGESNSSVSSASTPSLTKNLQNRVQILGSRFVALYCSMLTTKKTAALVILAMIGYFYMSIYGLSNMKAELKPEQLFLESSDVIQMLQLRNEYVIPFYAVCLVFVNNPGNITDPLRLQRLHSLVSDFESLPTSVGRFSTKFWLRDYEQFTRENSGDPSKEVLNDLVAFEGVPVVDRNKNELRQFLEWPEFQFWKGFLRIEPTDSSTDELSVRKFFFTTASYGTELKEWSKRVELLEQWRRVADSYPDLNVTVYEDEAKFLDLIPTMIPQTVQSSICTLFCMFLVCLLFMTHPTTVLISNIAILSTCIGVFGILGLLGTVLDPIVMSAAIMSIGFAVDIPAHIAYHFHKTGLGYGQKKSVFERLQECLTTIGFPVLEAGLSTIICVSSIFFVDLHMSQVFARTMVLVVAIGLIHGLLVIPVMFYIISLLSSIPSAIRSKLKPDATTKITPAAPIVLTVNQSEKA